MSTLGDGVPATVNLLQGLGGRGASRCADGLGLASTCGCSSGGQACGVRICLTISATPRGMAHSPTSVDRACPCVVGGRGVRCPSGVLTTTMRDALLGVIAPVRCRYDKACLDIGRGALVGSIWRSQVMGAASPVADSLPHCCWGRLRRGLPCTSVVHCRLVGLHSWHQR